MRSLGEIADERLATLAMTRTLARCCIYAGDVARANSQLAEALVELAEHLTRKVGGEAPAAELAEQEAGT